MRSLAILVAVTMPLWPWAGSAKIDPFVGRWRLIEQRSNVSSGVVAAIETNTFETIGQGIRITRQRGSTPPFSVDLNLDGKPHAAASGGLVARMTGADSLSAERTNSNMITITFFRHGKVVGTMKREVSKDGRTLTATAEGTSVEGDKFRNVYFFERE
jgi:hypothetical protein